MESAYRRRNLFDDSDEEETAQGKKHIHQFSKPDCRIQAIRLPRLRARTSKGGEQAISYTCGSR